MRAIAALMHSNARQKPKFTFEAYKRNYLYISLVIGHQLKSTEKMFAPDERVQVNTL